MMARQVSIAASVVGGAPVAGERRIEHLAQPMDDHRLLHLAQDAAIDPRVVVRALGGARQRAARHHDQPPPIASIASICSS
jgi:hypothetical protein